MILIGYLGVAPESKKMNFSAEIFNFRMANSESCTDKIPMKSKQNRMVFRGAF